MKGLFGSLLCLVLATSQSYALKGGPSYNAGNVETTGIYAGVLYPANEANAIGLFSVTVPRQGLGTGAVFVFANRRAYSGIIQGTADPDSSIFTAVISAEIGVDPDDDNVGGFGHTASGRVNGRITANANILSRASARLTGSSTIAFTSPPGSGPFPRIPFEVVGFKHANL